MDPLTIAGGPGVFGLMLLLLILWSLAIPAQERGADILGMGGASEPDQDQPRSTRDFLPRIRTNELLALQCLSMVGVPLLMIVFSVSLPLLRNPLFLIIGGFAGFLLPGSWLRASRLGRIALAAGLVLSAIWLVLAVMLQRA